MYGSSVPQYVFCKNISRVDALCSVWEYIVESKRYGEFTCLLTLDIKSAFSSVRRSDILGQLEESGFEHSLLGLIDDYLCNCSIILHEGEHFYNVGMPQGSCLDSVLWLMAINTLLTRLTEEVVWLVQSFADYTFVVAHSPAVYRQPS